MIEIAGTMRRNLQMLEATSKNPHLFVFAHSRGGAYLENALKLMSEWEKSVIHARTFGSASLFNNRELASLDHYVAGGDPVPMSDPINYFKARYFHSESSNVHFLPGEGSILGRHMATGETYAKQMRNEANMLLKLIGEIE